MDASTPALLTVSNRLFLFEEPTEDMVTLYDIAHALSMTCRYGGHTSDFYSVAQHSCLLAVAADHAGLPAEVKLAALFHDAAEAYVGDIPKPIRALLGDRFDQIEARVQAVIARKFQITQLEHPWIAMADALIVNNERRALFPRCEPAYPIDFLPGVEEITSWSPAAASVRFLAAAQYYFNQLAKQ